MSLQPAQAAPPAQRERAAPRAGRWLRHRPDRWPVAFTAVLLAVQLGLYAGLDDPRLLAIAAALLFPVQSVAIACCHDQHHRRVFRLPTCNRLYELALFLQTGLPPFLLSLHHNLGHHAHYRDQRLDSLRWRSQSGARTGLLAYLVDSHLGVYPRTLEIGARAPRLLRQLELMLVPSLATVALLAWARPLPGLLVFVAPMQLMVLNVIRIGYRQHAGLDLGSHLTASRNDVGALYNRLTFNSGYHTAHHLAPGLPWFDLPARHREIEAGTPPASRAG